MPTDNTSTLVIAALSQPGGNVHIAFHASTNRHYQLQSSENLINNTWNYDGFPFPGQAGLLTVAPDTQAPATPGDTLYYRLMIIPSPSDE